MILKTAIVPLFLGPLRHFIASIVMDCIDYVTGIGNLHICAVLALPVTDTYLATGERHGFSSPDFCAGRQNITQHGRSSRQYDKGIGVRAGGGCARNDCRCTHAGETLSEWAFPIPVT